METVYHQHHIVPRHAGGTNDPSNLVRLTIEEHAEAHRLLWEQHGKLQDKLAWLMLAGKTEEGELVRRELARENGRKRVLSEESRKKISESNKGHIPWNKGKTGVYSDETREKMKPNWFGQKPAWNIGIPHSEETKRKMSEKKKGMKWSEEVCQQRSRRMMGNKINLGRKHGPRSEEVKQRISAGLKARHLLKQQASQSSE